MLSILIQTCLALPTNEGGLLALGLVTIAGVGIDGIGIVLLVEFARLWIWLGTGRAEGTWASGAAIDAGIAGGIWGGIRTSTEAGADFLVSAAVVVILIWEGASGGGDNRTLDSDSFRTMIFCDEVVVVDSCVVGWALEEFGACNERKHEELISSSLKDFST